MTEYLHAGARQFGFMLRGLRELEPRLEALNIPFFLVKVGAKPLCPMQVYHASSDWAGAGLKRLESAPSGSWLRRAGRCH